MKLTCSKEYRDLPFAHRQHNHDGHCALIHGHNWTFKFTFVANELDENGFVIDFGKLKFLKEWLEKHFDHTLVLNKDDPELGYLMKSLMEHHSRPVFAKIVVVPNGSSEGLAQFLYVKVNELVQKETEGRVKVVKVLVQEDEKNAAEYEV